MCNFQLDFLADRFLEVVMDMCPDAASSTDREKEANYERCYGHDKIKDMFCHSCSQVSVYKQRILSIVNCIVPTGRQFNYL